MTKAGRKDIIVAESPKPRAVILGHDILTRTELLKSLFVGKHAGFYASQVLQSLGGTTQIIGPSTRDCYEMALQKPSLYLGESADDYMRLELEKNGFRPKVVTPERFDEILANLQPNEPDQK